MSMSSPHVSNHLLTKLQKLETESTNWRGIRHTELAQQYAAHRETKILQRDHGKFYIVGDEVRRNPAQAGAAFQAGVRPARFDWLTKAVRLLSGDSNRQDLESAAMMDFDAIMSDHTWSSGRGTKQLFASPDMLDSGYAGTGDHLMDEARSSYLVSVLRSISSLWRQPRPKDPDSTPAFDAMVADAAITRWRKRTKQFASRGERNSS